MPKVKQRLAFQIRQLESVWFLIVVCAVHNQTPPVLYALQVTQSTLTLLAHAR